jgi:hypothetical protein
MNGNFRPHSEEGADGADGLDPELMELFDTAAATPPSGAADAASREEFARSLLLKMQQARRLRLFWQISGLTTIMLVSAVLAPRVAQQTLLVADWLTDQQPGRAMSLIWPLGYMCASLFIWRIARRARTY